MAGIFIEPTDQLEGSALITDQADSLEPVGQLLTELRPSLLLLTDDRGRMIAVSHRGVRPDLHAADSLAKTLPARLCESRKCTFAVLHEGGFGLAFAVRLPATAGRAILGGVVELTEAAEERLGRLDAALAACGAATCAAVAAKREVADLQAQLRQAQKLQTIGRLAAGIAHEINTPAQYIRDNTRFVEDAFDKLQALLAACLQFQEAAQNEAITPDLVVGLVAAARQADVPFLMREVPAAIDQSLEGIDLVTRLLHSMKEFARPGGGRREAVDFNRAVETAATICRSQWKHVAELVTDLDPCLPVVRCLPDDVYQVLINLIINAAHAIEEKLEKGATEKGTITIGTAHDDRWVEIRVADTGNGIPEEIRQRVFGRFFTTKKAGRGSGQGLAIVRSIVADKYGGTITFSSETGRGTTFVVRIPLHGETVCGETQGDEEADPVC